jgi:acyl-CoA synthetase (AMP-forming)/AMP-acid ligase II
MKVALTVNDFIRRAELVYGDRIGLIDEPDQPAPSWGDLTYKRVAELARAQAAGLDRLGIGQGERVAIVSQNSARLMTSFFGVSGFGRVLVPINFRLNVDEVSYIVEHSGASVLLVDPELDEPLRDVRAKYRYVIGAEADEALLAFDAEPEPWTPDEARPRRSTTRAARRHGPRACSSRTATSGSTQRPSAGRRRDRSRRVPPHVADVPLQRMGDAVRGDRHGRSERRAAQGRRG